MRKITVFITTFLLALSLAVSVSALSKIGSVGSQVTNVQTALKEKGYYSGNIDGIFGIKTKNAVMNFQKDNGLIVDGIVGEKTLAALGIENKNEDFYKNYTSADYQLLARIISAEARGESYLGQVAVGAVVLNRIEHPSFPDTLSEVVYQKGAFSCLSDGQFYEEISDSAYNAARDALNGLDPTGGAIYYYNPAKATSKWIFSRPVITVIGNHTFCS